MKARAGIFGNERGAALLAVLAMVLLLAGFASLGLARLRAATDRITEAEARSEAQILAHSATAAALGMIGKMKERARKQPGAAGQSLRIGLEGGEVLLRFGDGGNCFNLNSLARPAAATGEQGQRPQADPADFARLLAAAGIPTVEASALAQATATRMQQTGMLWADASEWVTVPGVRHAHWLAAGALLCALPGREAASINVNSLQPAQAPLLVAMGLGPDEARRALAARPAEGWGSAGEFWQQASGAGVPDTAAAQTLGTTSRWVKLYLVVRTGRAVAGRELLLDTIAEPARVAANRWIAVGGQP